jgi:outer membrane protein assembly factor BamA
VTTTFTASASSGCSASRSSRASTPGDTVEPPPGFGDAVTYVQVAAGGDRDSRDTRGRPTRGTLIEFKLLGAFSVSGEDLAGLKLEAQTVYYLPVLPLARVLVLTGGATTTVKPLDDHEVPLHLFPALGRKRFLRGYERERFRDRHALWGNIEYRFPIYEYLATRVGLDAFLFFDGATAFGEDDLAPGNLRYSYGLGIRAAHDTRVLGGLTLGFSPEGFEINLGLGREL